jgi:hypothetical protein
MYESCGIEIVEFEELDQRAKDNAIQLYGEPPDDWYECVYARFKDDGLAKGFDLDDIQFSGFSSQGDGASWTGRVYLMPFIEHFVTHEHPEFSRYTVLLELLRNDWVDTRMGVQRRSFHYNHSGTMSYEGIRCYASLGEDNGDVIQHGILQGAPVYELDQAIDSERLVCELEEFAISRAKEYADEIYNALREEYEGYTSEENFKDLIYINGWRFNNKGEITDGV